MNALRFAGDDYTTVMSFALEMRTREIWFTYTTRDLPHKKGAIRETKFLGVISVTKPLLKQLKKMFLLNLQNLNASVIKI